MISQRKQLQDAELEKVCTFTPSMHTKKHHAENVSKEVVFERLANEKKVDLSPQKEISELLNCTFHPQISELAHGIRCEFILQYVLLIILH